jgi:hypothetical protein
MVLNPDVRTRTAAPIRRRGSETLLSELEKCNLSPATDGAPRARDAASVSLRGLDLVLEDQFERRALSGARRRSAQT